MRADLGGKVASKEKVEKDVAISCTVPATLPVASLPITLLLKGRRSAPHV